MAEAAIATLLKGLVVKTLVILYGTWFSRVIKTQPEVELRKDTFLTFDGWSKTLENRAACTRKEIVKESLKPNDGISRPIKVETGDVAARSIMLILQYWNVFHTKEDIESRKLVVQTVGSCKRIVKTFGCDITLGEHYLRELFVDLVSLLVSAPAMKTAFNQLPFWGYGVSQTAAAHVVQLLIMRSQRHMVSVLEGVRAHIDAANTRLIGSDICLQLFERSVFWETLFSPQPRYLNEEERHTNVLDLKTSVAEMNFVKEIMQIPIDALKGKGVRVIKNLALSTNSFEMIVAGFDNSEEMLEILKPYNPEIIARTEEGEENCHIIRMDKVRTLIKWLYKNEDHQKMSADEEKRMRHGVSSFQDMKTAHLDRMADWGRNMVQYMNNKNETIERNNPRVKILRETIEKLFSHSRISSAKHDVSKSLRYTVNATLEALVSTIGLVMSLMKFDQRDLDITALEEAITSVRGALAEHWWTPDQNTMLTVPRPDKA